MEEAFVDFETALLLQEKGFNWPVQRFYDQKGIICAKYCDYNDGKGWASFIKCPTQQMVLAWFRTKGIDVIPFHELFEKDYYWCRIEKKSGNYLFTEFQQDPIYPTYEIAVENAIKYVLNNLLSDNK